MKQALSILALVLLFAISTSAQTKSKTDKKLPDTKTASIDQQTEINEIKRLENLRLRAGIAKDINAFDSST